MSKSDKMAEYTNYEQQHRRRERHVILGNIGLRVWQWQSIGFHGQI